MPVHEPRLQEIAGRPGAYYTGYQVGTRAIEIDIALIGTSESDLRDDTRALAANLRRPTPKALSFSDEPNKLYWAFLGAVDWDSIALCGVGTIRFICADPFIHATSATDNSVTTGDNTISNSGTAPTYPLLTLTATQDSSFLKVSNQTGKYILIGQAPDAEGAEVNGWVDDFSDDCSTMDWSAGGAIDNGSTTGAVMSATGGYFYASNYGSVTSGWLGPSVRRALGTAATNFEVEARVDLRAVTAAIGRIELYLRDTGGNCIGKIGMRDVQTGDNYIQAEARAGSGASSKTFYSGTPTNKYLWKSYNEGRLLISRVGNLWTAKFGIYNTGTKEWSSRLTKEWVDAAGTWTAQLTHVDLHIGKYKTFTALTNAYIKHVWARRYTAPGATETPKVIKSGDEIVIDFSRNRILRNGEPWLTELQVGSQFFPLDPGSNTFTIESGGTISSGHLYVTPRWW
jgi:predicted phage tail component-like protein